MELAYNRGAIEVTEGSHTHVIPVEALASWGELLGYEDPVDTFNAILHVAENGEPEPDPETGENVWTAPYVALAKREQLQAAEAYKQVDKSVEVRSLALRQALAASTVKSEVVEAQESARNTLGLPPPSSVRAMGSSSKDPVRDLLHGLTGEIEMKRQEFLGQFTP